MIQISRIPAEQCVCRPSCPGTLEKWQVTTPEYLLWGLDGRKPYRVTMTHTFDSAAEAECFAKSWREDDWNRKPTHCDWERDTNDEKGP